MSIYKYVLYIFYIYDTTCLGFALKLKSETEKEEETRQTKQKGDQPSLQTLVQGNKNENKRYP